MKKRKIKENDVVMMFDIWHHHRVYKKLLPKWFGYFVIKKMFLDNGSYELGIVNGSIYVDPIKYDKLKKYLDMWFLGLNP